MTLRNVCLAALTAAVGLGTLLFFAAGGCGGPTRGAPRAVSARRPLEVGRDPRLVARLEAPASATATVYPADESGSRREDVVLAPGAWIVPESAFVPPEAAHAR